MKCKIPNCKQEAKDYYLDDLKVCEYCFKKAQEVGC